MTDKEEISEDFKKFGIGEILAQFMMNDDARELANGYIQGLEQLTFDLGKENEQLRKRNEELLNELRILEVK